MKKYIFLLVLIFPLTLMAQGRQVMRGRVMYESSGISDVLIVNYTAQAETRTDSLGYFMLQAQTGDLFVASDYKIKTKKIRFTSDLIRDKVLILNVQIEATELEELEINRSSVTAQSLGIVPKGQIRYTPAERRLKTAGDFAPSIIGGTYGVGFGVSVDAIINAINGRTKRLRKEVATERKEMLIAKADALYSEEQLMATYGIPPEYKEAFLYYIAEDVPFAQAMALNDKLRSDFLLGGLAENYIKLINEVIDEAVKK